MGLSSRDLARIVSVDARAYTANNPEIQKFARRFGCDSNISSFLGGIKKTGKCVDFWILGLFRPPSLHPLTGTS